MKYAGEGLGGIAQPAVRVSPRANRITSGDLKKLTLFCYLKNLSGLISVDIRLIPTIKM